MADPRARAPGGVARHPLSRRLALLMVASVLVIEALVFLPSLQRMRTDWIEHRVTEAQLAALSGPPAPDAAAGTAPDRADRDDLLLRAGVEAIELREAGHSVGVLAPRGPLPPDIAADPGAGRPLGALDDAVRGLFLRPDRLFAVTASSASTADRSVTVVLHRASLDRALSGHLHRVGGISLLVAGAVGLLLYAALQRLLVRPLRRLTESIATFRADPERALPLDPSILDPSRSAEIAAAAAELAAMQQELRASLWRNARMAALGTAMAKISHDLRGILSPALLTAGRLQMSQDAAVKRAGDTLVRAVERATDLVSQTLDFTRETPAAPPAKLLRLRPAVAEAAEQACAGAPWLAVENAVPAEIDVEVDRESLLRVLANLLRNAGEARARRARVACEHDGFVLALTVTDDGPGLPDNVRAALFQPFVTGPRRGSTGLGLAIVRDLVRAHGGDVTLLSTGPTGTCFRLTLPSQRPLPAAADGALAGR